MEPVNNTINFTLYLEGERYQIKITEDEYNSLMCLISENFTRRNFGICYGGGCCGTCGVVITEAGTNSRKFTLSCEIRIDHELSDKVVTLL